MTVSAVKSRATIPAAEAAKTQAQTASARIAVLLKEILDYQIRLNRLSVRSTADEDYLISAYKRQIERRQNLLDALTKPLEAAPNPWRTAET